MGIDRLFLTTGYTVEMVHQSKTIVPQTHLTVCLKLPNANALRPNREIPLGTTRALAQCRWPLKPGIQHSSFSVTRDIHTTP